MNTERIEEFDHDPLGRLVGTLLMVLAAAYGGLALAGVHEDPPEPRIVEAAPAAGVAIARR